MQYLRVTSVNDLLERLSAPGSAILCGGTDLWVKIRAGLAAPETLLDISDLDELRAVQLVDGSIEIGAAVPEEDLLRSPILAEHLPLLVDVLRVLGSTQIRNRGTLGGNLVNASPAADSAIPLLLYEASVLLQRAGGERTVPLSEFFRAPSKTALDRGEFVRCLRVPVPGRSFTTFFHKVGKRRALTIAIASVGALLDVDDGRVVQARFAAGSVAPVPLRLEAVERLLVGSRLDANVIAEARTAALESVSPISDVRASADYRREVVADLVVRALRAAG